jgi:hypothetical protein
VLLPGELRASGWRRIEPARRSVPAYPPWDSNPDNTRSERAGSSVGLEGRGMARAFWPPPELLGNQDSNLDERVRLPDQSRACCRLHHSPSPAGRSGGRRNVRRQGLEPRTFGLRVCRSAIELAAHGQPGRQPEIEPHAGIEPASSAWRAVALAVVLVRQTAPTLVPPPGADPGPSGFQPDALPPELQRQLSVRRACRARTCGFTVPNRALFRLS